MATAAPPLFAWTRSLEINHPEIDRQHQLLVSYLNELADAMREGRAKAVLSQLLAKLIQYTDQHFQHEERLMLVSHYPGATTHKMLHDDLRQRVAAFSRAFHAGEPVNVLEVMNFLKEWLRTHIGGADRRFGQFLAAPK